MSPARVSHDGDRGWIVAIGGAEDKLSDVGILRRFAALAGGPEARIAIIPTVSMMGDTGARYESLFRGLGVGAAESLAYLERADASRPDSSRPESVKRLVRSPLPIFLAKAPSAFRGLVIDTETC